VESRPEAAQGGWFSFGDVTALTRSNLSPRPIEQVDVLPIAHRQPWVAGNAGDWLQRLVRSFWLLTQKL